MNMTQMNRIFIILMFMMVFGCQIKTPIPSRRLVNFSHLHHLSDQVIIDGEMAKFIGIYSEFPDYQIVADDDEGIACVDDAARAAVAYGLDFRLTHNDQSLESMKNLLNFILSMQEVNGLFYNFVLPDLGINKMHQNSKALPGWWSWRAFWAISEGFAVFSEQDTDFSRKLEAALLKVLPAIETLLETYSKTLEIEGITVPTWLPYETAADQAGVIILALCAYERVTPGEHNRILIQKISNGIRLMQTDSSGSFPRSCFLSWQNTWHAYGNIQSYALLLASEVLNDSAMMRAALNELDHFYPELIKRDYLNNFSLVYGPAGRQVFSRENFPQIAYGIRPMVWAYLKAYGMTGQVIYARRAVECASWLFGKNAASRVIYDPQTGRCFDGINSPDSINLNSGAESTVEALLTLLVMEQFPILSEELDQYYLEFVKN